jgi:5-methylcytosine-specific restriction enzyme A
MGKRTNDKLWVDKRIKGRRAVELRRRRLAAEPLCRDCMRKGLVNAATVPDHIKPLAQDGTDTDDNIRCLCSECHRKRTAEQFGRRYRPPIGLDGWPTG